MNKAFKLFAKPFAKHFAVMASSALLFACGGGGPTVISSGQAIGALSAAKSSNTAFVNEMVYLSNQADPLVALTAANWSTAGNGVTYTANCAYSGSYRYVYSKAFYAAGLSAGDYYSVTYSQCLQSANGVELRGNLIMSALTSTYTDQRTSATFSLPVSLIFNNYSEAGTALAKTYNGTVDFTANSAGVSGSGSETIESSTVRLTVASATAAGVTSARYDNAALVYRVPASGATVLGTAFDVSLSPSGSQLSVASSLVGLVSAPTSGTYTVTNVYGGRVAGSIPSNLISVDYGNDGTIDATFYQAF